MDLKDVSKKRQKKWKDTDLYKVTEDTDKPKFYILDMFPYPSGSALHVGHPKGYIATDCLARKKILEGFNVLHPMGFDTFGLGTEQYAIEHKMKPQVVSQKNIETFIQQLETFGTTYDRSRSVNTADPKYFKRTQRVFLQMYNHYYDEKLEKAMPIASLKLRIENGELKINEDIEKYLNKQRLAYVDYKPINRCPSCMTGLANEDLDDGKCERCGSEVEQKPMKQRVLRITKYAERLLTGLDTLQREESMKDLERNRIGKSEGTQFKMNVVTSKVESQKSNDLMTGGSNDYSFEVYTTRIDTVFGMSFVAIAPEHPLLTQMKNEQGIVKNWKEIEAYKEQANKKTQLERTELQKDKTGVKIEGIRAINPFNNEKVPIFVADYVLANYGTGVVMAVPAHDERDFEFAKKYDLPVKKVVEPFTYYASGDSAVREGLPFVERENVCVILRDPKTDTYLCVDWKDHDMHGLITGGIDEGEDSIEAAQREIYEESGYKHVKYIRDPDFAIHTFFWHRVKQSNRHARFRYLMFELVSDERDEIAPEEAAVHTLVWKTKEELKTFFTVAEGSFALNFLDNMKYIYVENGILHDSGAFTGMKSEEAIPAMQAWLKDKGIGGVKVNYKMQDRVFSRQRYRGEPFPIVRTEDGKIIALDEKDLPIELPDVENYAPTGTEEGPLANITDWVNVTLPDGRKAKRETNTMPGRAGSSRYWLRYMDVNNDKELVGKDEEKYRGSVDVYVGGAEHITRHMIYGRFWQKFLFDIGSITHEEPFQEYHSVGLIMGEDGRKMSKRRGNVVNPDDIINEFGTDVLRAYEMFMGPFEQSIAWSTNGIKGVKKFLDKIIALKDKISEQEESQATQIILNQSIKKLTEDIDAFRFNTGVSQLMILVNHLTECPSINKKTFEDLVILVSPFAPHIAEELREQLGNEYSVFTKATWPKYDEKYLVADTVTIAVQVNGKVRGTLSINKEAEEDEVMKLAKADPKIAARIVNEPKKVIYVKGKILNIVV